MHPTPAPWWKKLFVATEIFIGINIVILDIYLFHLLTHPDQQPLTSQQPIPTIQAPVSSQDTLLSQPTATPTQAITIPTPPANTVQSAVKEYFVPFGSGQGAYTSWTTVPGLQAYIDSKAYPNISKVTFEATVRVPTGNQTVSLRLFNSTDGHPVWFSDLNFSGSSNGVFESSQNVSLDAGNKLYIVQMQTQLGATTNIDQARLHITLK